MTTTLLSNPTLTALDPTDAVGPMHVVLQRHAIIGTRGGLGYDVYVLESDCPSWIRERNFMRVIDDGRRLLHFEIATLPAAFFEIHDTAERMTALTLHYQDAGRTARRLAECAFPELLGLETDRLPTLWVHGLLPREDSTSSEHTGLWDPTTGTLILDADESRDGS